MENNERKAPVSVCDIRVQTAEGVNIPCRLPRPCKDHEPGECGRTYLDGAFWKDCQNPRPCKDHEVCGYCGPDALCNPLNHPVGATKPCPIHEPSEGQFGNVGGRCSPGVSTTPTPQQEEESWEARFDEEFMPWSSDALAYEELRTEHEARKRFIRTVVDEVGRIKYNEGYEKAMREVRTSEGR